jgi:long-chain acyl-CoA synthetase
MKTINRPQQRPGRRREQPRGFPEWPRRRWARWTRVFLQEAILFPGLRLLYGRRVHGVENLDDVHSSVIFISNHNMHLDQSVLLAALPRRVRRRMSIAAAADDIYGNRVRAFGASLVGNAFPFSKRGLAKDSLEHALGLLDEGWSVMMFPEGRLTVMGPIQPFRAGIGLLATASDRPVVPMRTEVLRRSIWEGKLWPPRGLVEVRIGAPLHVPAEMEYEEAAAMLEASVRAL